MSRGSLVLLVLELVGYLGEVDSHLLSLGFFLSRGLIFFRIPENTLVRDTKIREVHPRSVLCPLGVLIHLCSWWSCLCCDLCSSRSSPTPNSRVRDFFVCESFDLVFLALICSMTWVEHFHRRKSLESSQERRSGEFCVRDRFLARVRVIWIFSQSTRLIL